jgi:hypothetical protein
VIWNLARAGDVVRHPLWPELGVGEVTEVSGDASHIHRWACVSWPTGQVSKHALSVLRVVLDA